MDEFYEWNGKETVAGEQGEENAKQQAQGSGVHISPEEETPAIPAWRSGRHEVIANHFPAFMGCALAFGIFYTFCLYKNPMGITYPLMVAGGIAVLVAMQEFLGMKVKPGSWFLAGMAFLLGVSVCRTADAALILMNKDGIFLLLLIFMVHQFYDDKGWSVGKYMAAILTYLLTCIGTLFHPFLQGRYFFRNVNLKKYKTAAAVGTGLLCAVPILLAAGFLLGQADAVFGDLVMRFFDTFFNVWNLMVILFMVALSALTMYWLVCGGCEGNIAAGENHVRTREPIIAITCMGAVALLYLLFSGIQVVYLFMGKGSLPEGMTFSSYARQGFFQLLFVAAMNLVMVLMSLKLFKNHSLLNLILTVICVCTYVMIASAAYRMALYVGEYHLTYLRVLVLWFLALLAVLFVGVIVLVYRNHFPLFWYFLTVTSVLFVALSFARPQKLIAQYNGKFAAEWSGNDLLYVTRDLSADAVPEVINAAVENGLKERFDNSEIRFVEDCETLWTWDDFLQYYYKWTVGWDYEEYNSGLRRYNFSVEKAMRIFEAEGAVK